MSQKALGWTQTDDQVSGSVEYRKHGLCRFAQHTDLAALVGLHRPYYQELKKSLGWRSGEKLPPHFFESLQRLIDQGYGISDIGAMVGVTRERVRQWAAKGDIKRLPYRGTCFRTWDDRTNQFRLATPEEMAVLYAPPPDPYFVERDRCRDARRAEQIGVVRALYRELGRAPLAVQVTVAMGYKRKEGNRIAGSWGYPKSHKSTRAWNLLYAAAGMPYRPDASPHIGKAVALVWLNPGNTPPEAHGSMCHIAGS